MHDQLETNFFGLVRVTLRALKIMRESGGRGGLLINISSLAGVCSFPGQAFYHAIHFCLVEPGSVKTNFETSSKKRIASHPAYADPSMPSRMLEAFVEQSLASGGAVEAADLAALLYHFASPGEKIPLYLPVSTTATGLITMSLTARLEGVDAVKELSAVDKKRVN
ncbi:NAD(P)-binding protein [Aspergillus terreus]|uniref:NAD(P)-binding protein n=1 Tax=Aspergillus terreus TaxID=33178 RepID=A0A5M3Z1G7_ASPTE|nr:hypothetical protein ATETN484_0007042700 [Aspergillus terreus]GFF16232.1 NAD(P)-binding protein [Aspergillus terreus]